MEHVPHMFWVVFLSVLLFLLRTTFAYDSTPRYTTESKYKATNVSCEAKRDKWERSHTSQWDWNDLSNATARTHSFTHSWITVNQAVDINFFLVQVNLKTYQKRRKQKTRRNEAVWLRQRRRSCFIGTVAQYVSMNLCILLASMTRMPSSAHALPILYDNLLIFHF